MSRPEGRFSGPELGKLSCSTFRPSREIVTLVLQKKVLLSSSDSLGLPGKSGWAGDVFPREQSS